MGRIGAKAGASAPCVGKSFKVGGGNAWGETLGDEGIGVGNFMGKRGEGVNSVSVVPFLEAENKELMDEIWVVELQSAELS